MVSASALSFAVIGAGSWGTALSTVLAKNKQTVTLWDRDSALLESIQKNKKNDRYLPSIPLPSGIHCARSLKEAVEQANHILVVVPSHAFTEIIQALKPFLTPEKKISFATKGLEAKTGKFLHQVLERELGDIPFAILSGPSFAREVAEGLPTAVCIASKSLSYAKELAQAFNNNHFRVYVTQDILGVQLGGVVKNILAVAVGISDGMKLGANARAALMTRGLAEMMRLGEALGAKRETLMGLAGCGDIILTCTDDQSRNRRFGLLLASGLSEKEALQKIGQVVEAVYNVEQLCNLAKMQGVELPIAEQVFQIMKHQITPREAVNTLFARLPKME